MPKQRESILGRERDKRVNTVALFKAWQLCREMSCAYFEVSCGRVMLL
jgi:hypothetical protein